jgi:hypothetical protein
MIPLANEAARPAKSARRRKGFFAIAWKKDVSTM